MSDQTDSGAAPMARVIEVDVAEDRAPRRPLAPRIIPTERTEPVTPSEPAPVAVVAPDARRRRDRVMTFGLAGVAALFVGWLAVDTVEDMFRLPDLTHVVIVGGDSDYIALAQRCKRLGRYVVGIGVAGASSRSLAAACDASRDLSRFGVGGAVLALERAVDLDQHLLLSLADARVGED